MQRRVFLLITVFFTLRSPAIQGALYTKIQDALGVSKGNNINANSYGQTSMITVKWCWAWQMRQAIEFCTAAYFNLSLTL